MTIFFLFGFAFVFFMDIAQSIHPCSHLIVICRLWEGVVVGVCVTDQVLTKLSLASGLL